MVEDDIGLVLGEYNSSFVKYELTPSIYAFREFSQAFFNIPQPEHPLPIPIDVIHIEFDDITMKTKLVVRPSNIATRFEKTNRFLVLSLVSIHIEILNTKMNTFVRKM